MRRLFPVWLPLAALLALTVHVSAQIRPGIHVARAADFAGGASGVGGSVEMGFPLLPIDIFLAGDYFFPDCGGPDCHLWGGSADVHFTGPFPLVTPYAALGLVYRDYTFAYGDQVDSSSAVGVGVGAGVELGLGVGAYAEGRYEFVDPNDQFVFRIGIRF